MRLQTDSVVPCDILLVKGSCLMDESILTGESVPVTKISAESDRKVNSLNIVYGGSRCILEKSDQVLGVVINTGWNSFKGKIISSMVSRQDRPNLIFQQMITITKFYILISVLMFVAIVVYDAALGQLYLVRVIKYMGDFLTKGFQPSVWFILFVSVYIISLRLNSDSISILNPKKLFSVGLTDTICFDKTGTLTENKILFHGVLIRNSSNGFSPLYSKIDESLGESKFGRVLAMSSCCHDLFIHEGRLIGDPIDMELFKFSGSSMNVIRNDLKFLVGERKDTLRDSAYVRPQQVFARVLGKGDNFGYGIVRVFPFSSELKRMGVLVKPLDNLHQLERHDKNSYYTNKMIFDSHQPPSQGLQQSMFARKGFCLLVKGAAESVKKICRPESIPHDFDDKVNEYAKQGLRIIALAYREVEDAAQTQAQLESDLEFLGLMMFDNPLKASTRGMVDRLKFNNFDCKMITGDHLYAAINVGYTSGILEQTESLWICSLGPHKRRLQWRFSTFEELMKLQHTQRQLDAPLVLEKRTNKVSIEQSIKLRLSQMNQSILTSHKKYQTEIKRADIRDLPGVIASAQRAKIRASLAMEGSCFEHIWNHTALTPKQRRFILKRTKIFGRANPNQKKDIVRVLRAEKNPRNKCVGFVGDGANDFKALNQADFGLSIDNTEASIASPFVSAQAELDVLEKLLIEGRLSVENFDQIFIYSICYTILDYICLLFVIKLGFYYHNWKYIVEFLVRIPLLLLVCTIRPVSRLRRAVPHASLIGTRFFVTLAWCFAVSLVAFAFGLAIIHRFPFFKPSADTFNSVNLNVENHFSPQSSLLLLLLFVLNLANLLSVFKGRVVKRSWYSSWVLVLYLGCFVAVLLLSFCTELFVTLEPVVEFFVSYARVNDFATLVLLKWVFYCALCFLIFFFSANFIANHFYYKSLKKQKLLYRNRFLAGVPVDAARDETLRKQVAAFKEQNTFSSISVSHSIIYD